jgi:hypothetical protein
VISCLKLFCFKIFFLNFYIFKTTGKLKIFEPKKSHRSVDFDELILKIYTVLSFQIVFPRGALQKKFGTLTWGGWWSKWVESKNLRRKFVRLNF